MSVESAVGMTIGLGVAGAATYDVRTITKNDVADNKAYVSSLTGGETFRVAGNLDATWAISLYAPSGIVEVPDELRAGQIVQLKTPLGGGAVSMIVDDSSLEIDIEAGELHGISLSTSAVNANSYVV